MQVDIVRRRTSQLSKEAVMMATSASRDQRDLSLMIKSLVQSVHREATAPWELLRSSGVRTESLMYLQVVRALMIVKSAGLDISAKANRF
jgi:hypothetical protein